jgi:hypothetical protein
MFARTTKPSMKSGAHALHRLARGDTTHGSTVSVVELQDFSWVRAHSEDIPWSGVRTAPNSRKCVDIKQPDLMA